MNRDFLGTLLSSLCIVHCLALPAVLAFGGVGVSLTYEHSHSTDHWIHGLILVPILFVVLASFPKSFVRHKNGQPAMLGGIGIFALVLGLVLPHDYEMIFNVVGGLLLIVAHSSNRRLVSQFNKVA